MPKTYRTLTTQCLFVNTLSVESQWDIVAVT